MENMAKRIKGSYEGTLNLGVIPTVAPSLLPRFIPEFKSKFPDITLKIEVVSNYFFEILASFLRS